MEPPGFFSSLAARPFDTALASLPFSAGLFALFGLSLEADPLSMLVPTALLIGLSVAYALSGVFLIIGIGFRLGNVEAAGCILLVSGVMVRLIAVIVEFGLNARTIAVAILYVVVATMTIIRLRQIWRDVGITTVRELE